MIKITRKIVLWRPSLAVLGLLLAFGISSCTQETQNRISRGIQNWTGTNGVLDVVNGGKVMYRFIQIDKLSTAIETGGKHARPYRYGYGIMDLNFNYKKDRGEKSLYFEISDYSTQYVFYDNPNP